MTSNDPMTGFEYQGAILPNASINLASASGGGSIDTRIDGCDDFTDEEGTVGTCEVLSTGASDGYSTSPQGISLTLAVSTSSPVILLLVFKTKNVVSTTSSPRSIPMWPQPNTRKSAERTRV